MKIDNENVFCDKNVAVFAPFFERSIIVAERICMDRYNKKENENVFLLIPNPLRFICYDKEKHLFHFLAEENWGDGEYISEEWVISLKELQEYNKQMIYEKKTYDSLYPEFIKEISFYISQEEKEISNNPDLENIKEGQNFSIKALKDFLEKANYYYSNSSYWIKPCKDYCKTTLKNLSNMQKPTFQSLEEQGAYTLIFSRILSYEDYYKERLAQFQSENISNSNEEKNER